MVSGTCALPKEVVLEVEGEAGQRSRRVNDLCFHTYGKFSAPPPPPGIGPFGWDWTSRLRFGSQGWDLVLQTRILAPRLGFGPQG